MIDMIAIPGADELVGKGVYRGSRTTSRSLFEIGMQSLWARRLNARRPRGSLARPGGASPREERTRLQPARHLLAHCHTSEYHGAPVDCQHV
jgi:hypothetical protein